MKVLIDETEERFVFLIFDPSVSPSRLRAFYTLLTIPIFNSSLNDETDGILRKSILGNPVIMNGMPDIIKMYLFMILASHTQAKIEDKRDINDDLLI